MALKNRATPWSYKKGETPLHKMSAGSKLAFLLLLSLAAFFPGPESLSLIVLGIAAITLVLLSFIARIGPGTLLRGSSPLFLMVLAVFLFQAVEFSPPGINFTGLKESAFFCARLATAFAAGTLLFSVTTSGEIRKSLSRLEVFLRLKKLKLGLCLSLMLGFIPMLFQIWEDINLAWESRSGKKNLSRLLVLVPLLIERMMVQAGQIALAMEARSPMEAE